METTNNRGNKTVQSATEPTEVDNCAMVVNLIHTSFWEGKLAEEVMWQAVVLIPKGKNNYQGIGLVET